MTQWGSVLAPPALGRLTSSIAELGTSTSSPAYLLEALSRAVVFRPPWP